VELTDLDPAIDNAMSGQDRAALDSLLADDFIYTHANGHAEAKPEFIATILARTNPPRRVLDDVHAEQHGDIIVSHGNLDIIYHDDRPNLYMRYVRVYREADGRWLAISHRTVYARDRGPAAN
jgi:ketosteroid isomerase-like protein